MTRRNVATRLQALPPLPVDEAIPALRHALIESVSAVLQAPPGAGKTTRVPLALLDEPWLGGRKIVMLEPRRLAARAAAAHMARLLGERVGETVGYRVRLDTRVSASTRVEIVTEGVLVRLLQADPALEGTGLVVFDEFHERSLHADLGLALALQARSLLRPDLRLLVMSATLDGAPVSRLLDDAPIVTSEGRSFPVETYFDEDPGHARIETVAARVALQALNAGPGDVLVFLPGAGEIHRAAELLRDRVPAHVRVEPLYGNLPQDAQDRAIAPGAPGERKIVLSTAIAETSLTIEGVRTVVDSGLMRVPRFSPRTGMTRLETVTVSRASADQRRGRAGRLGPGVCYRLWSEAADRALVPQSTPEILESDLAPLALELAAWGIADPAELRWLDAPPAAALAQARELLIQLGALEEAGAITAAGRSMAALAVHPRLAHMLIEAAHVGGDGARAAACDLAALLGERDPLRGDGPAPDADLRLRLEALRTGSAAGRHGGSIDRGALSRIRAESENLRRQLRVPSLAYDSELAGPLLALAYPDRVAQRRGDTRGRFLLRNGRGAGMDVSQSLAGSDHLVVADVADQGRDSRIFLAAPLATDELRDLFSSQVLTHETIEWDPETGGIRARRQERLGALVLSDADIARPEPAAVRDALMAGIRREGLGILSWSDAAKRLRERIAFLHSHDERWPDVADAALLDTLDAWLSPFLDGVRRRDQIARVDVIAALEAMLPWPLRRELDALAPTHVAVPSGSTVPIDYSEASAPVLAVRLQEMFGLAETPRVLGGTLPLTLHLLSPARRPVQVTKDLASFWRSAYFEVRKDLRGRYPKHYWPEDPLIAEPTRRAKPRGS